MIKPISLALALLALGTTAHAQDAGQTTTQDHPNNANSSASASDASSGINVTANASALHGTSAYATLYTQAIADYNAHNFNDAAKELRSVVKKAPNDANIHLMLSNIYLSQKNYADALPQLEAAVKYGANDPVTRDNLGEVYLQQNRPADAVAQFKAVLARAPKDDTATQGMALALSQTGGAGDAIAALQKLAADKPSAATYANLAVALQKSGKTADAAQAFQKAAALNPKNADLPFYAGESYVQSGSNDKAIVLLTQALALKTQYQFLAHVLLSQAYSNSGVRDKAISELQAATTVQPNDPSAWFNLGVLQKQAGQTEAAKQDFGKVISLKTAAPGLLAQAQQALTALQAAPAK